MRNGLIQAGALSVIAWAVAFCPCLVRGNEIDAYMDGAPARYSFVAMAEKPWRLCAVIPHAKDQFFWDVAWGLVEQARKAGVFIGIYQAGGYENLEIQKEQIRSCIKEQADAVLIAAIDPDGFDAEQQELAARGIPVIDLVNGLNGRDIAAHSHLNFKQNADVAANYALFLAAGRKVEIAWFPGPLGSSWSTTFDDTIRNDLSRPRPEEQPILISGGWGATDKDTQATLVRHMAEKSAPDIILANAVAAAFAARFYAHGQRHPAIISLYSNDDALEALREGSIAAIVVSSPADQARIGIDLTIRVLQHMAVPKLVSIPSRLLTRNEVEDFVKSDARQGTRIPLPFLPQIGAVKTSN